MTTRDRGDCYGLMEWAQSNFQKGLSKETVQYKRGLVADGTTYTYYNLLSEEEQEVWEPYYPEEPSPVTCGFYAFKEGHFWLTLVRTECPLWSGFSTAN